MTAREAIAEIASRLIRALPAEEVWLFGSYARDEAHPDSDLDFLAVMNDSSLSALQRSRLAHAAVEDIRFAKDIVVLTQREWRDQEHVVNTLPHIARREGIRVASR